MKAKDLILFFDRARELHLSPFLAYTLVQLENEGLPIGELCARIGASTACGTGIADRLERGGLVHRRQGTDRRTVILSLTSSGRAALSILLSPQPVTASTP